MSDPTANRVRLIWSGLMKISLPLNFQGTRCQNFIDYCLFINFVFRRTTISEAFELQGFRWELFQVRWSILQLLDLRVYKLTLFLKGLFLISGMKNLFNMNLGLWRPLFCIKSSKKLAREKRIPQRKRRELSLKSWGSNWINWIRELNYL